MYQLCVKNGLVVNDDWQGQADVYVKEGKICAVTEPGLSWPAQEVIDAEGCYVFPGFLDPHAHLNDPGLTESEDFYTGTCAAAAGGITTVLEHPLTMPLPDRRQYLAEKEQICGGKAVTDFGLFGACTPDNRGELNGMLQLGACAFKAFLPYSPEIPQLSDHELLTVMEELRDKEVLLAIHCENDTIVRTCTQKLIQAGRMKPEDYEAGRPEVAEQEAVSRMALFAQETGGRLHVVHCSTPRSVDVVADYKQKGVDVTVETCPHFLILHTEDVRQWGVYGICNPPLRHEQTVNALWERVLAGKVDFIGSDHATYTFAEKEEGRDNVFLTPAGLSGIQTCFPMFFDEAVNKRQMPLNQFVAMTSANAAKRFGFARQKGRIAPGWDGDLTVFNPQASWEVKEERLFYKMKWTPYMGRTVQGEVQTTVVRGQVVYRDGQITAKAGVGAFVKPDREGSR